MTNYGVIDLGSNSVRLVVFDVRNNDRPERYTKKDFRNIVDEKKIAGLSAYVSNGTFTKAGIARTIEVLNEHLEHAKNFQCKEIRIFATAVLRNCTNSKSAIKTIEESIHTPIDLLSERAEAHLGFVGAMCDMAIHNGTLADIGGGSTELTTVVDGEDSHNVSLGCGCVSTYAQHVSLILPTIEERQAVRETFLNQLNALPDLEPYRCTTLYGIGGSTRAAMKLYGFAFSNGIRPKSLKKYQIKAIFDLLDSEPSTFAHIAAKAVPDRLHTVMTGCEIAYTLMETFGAETLEIRKFGVREGYLIERILGKR